MSKRPAYTLIEVLMAIAIGTLLLAALYAALSLQMRGMSDGRDLVERTAVVRSLFNRFSGDIAASINLVDPPRFRNLAAADAAAQQQAAAGTGASGMTGATGMTGGAATGGMTTGGMASGGTATGGTATAGAGGTTTDPALDPSSQGSASLNGIPLGVVGDAQSVHLYVSKATNETSKGDVRRLSYWLGQQGGLCRSEDKVILSPDALAQGIPSGDEATYNIAPEIQNVEFSYFDGTGWQESWNCLDIGPDNATPIGPPRAIAIKLTVRPPDGKGDPKTYRHVVVIPTANGPAQTSGGGTTP